MQLINPQDGISYDYYFRYFPRLYSDKHQQYIATKTLAYITEN